MTRITEEQMAEFIAACHRVADYGLLRCSSGNLSWRIDKERMLVTATRSWLADLNADDVAVLRISDSAVLAGATPSSETRFHLGILRNRLDVNVVLHFQSPGATTLACAQPQTVNFFVIPEIPYYIGPIAIVPYVHPSSAELAQAVIPAMATHNLAVLTNHGQVTVGRTFDEALQRAAFFELACQVILAGGDKVRPLSNDAVAKLMSGSGNA